MAQSLTTLGDGTDWPGHHVIHGRQLWGPIWFGCRLGAAYCSLESQTMEAAMFLNHLKSTKKTTKLK